MTVESVTAAKRRDEELDQLSRALDRSRYLRGWGNHRWAQYNVAQGIGALMLLGALFVDLCQHDVVGAVSLGVGAFAFMAGGFAIADWANDLLDEAIDVLAPYVPANGGES